MPFCTSPYAADVPYTGAGAGVDFDADGDAGADAGFEDSGFFEREVEALGGGAEVGGVWGMGFGVGEVEGMRGGWVGVEDGDGDGDRLGELESMASEGEIRAPASTKSTYTPPSPTHSLSHSLDSPGADTLRAFLSPARLQIQPQIYAPAPHILAAQPPAPPDPTALYAPLRSSRFPTAAAARLHRKRSRLAPKAAKDVARVKALGREYWVCRIYNAMVNAAHITDGSKSIHRTRFTTRAAFEAVDLEAAAHAVFDEALAVHERGWNLPLVYYKAAVRGRLVDVSGDSVEMRLSRICVVLAETKSAVDDAVRGGVTLALLCDNPEARRFTKESNNLGNRKRGERLKGVATRERAGSREVEGVDVEGVGVEGVEVVSGAE